MGTAFAWPGLTPVRELSATTTTPRDALRRTRSRLKIDRTGPKDETRDLAAGLGAAPGLAVRSRRYSSSSSGSSPSAYSL
jgi:hypothetical protein